MKLFFFSTILSVVTLCSCLSIPKATIREAKQADLKTMSDELFAGKYSNDSNAVVYTDSLANARLKMQLRNLHISTITIDKKDSIILYDQQNKYLSVRLYRWEKYTTIRYDCAAVPRSFSYKKDEFSTASKKISDRAYIYSYKEPGLR